MSHTWLRNVCGVAFVLFPQLRALAKPDGLEVVMIINPQWENKGGVSGMGAAMECQLGGASALWHVSFVARWYLFDSGCCTVGSKHFWVRARMEEGALKRIRITGHRP